MARFKVTLLSSNGNIAEQIVEAKDKNELFRMFSKTNYLVIGIKKQWYAPLLKLKNIFFRRGISKQDLADFCFYIGRSLEMGLPILDTLNDTSKTTKNKLLKEKIDEIRNAIISGSSISTAMKDAGIFPPDLVGMVKVGESTDALPKVFLNYADFLDWLISLEKEVKQAMSYPLFTSIVMVFVIAIMFGYIIPNVIPAIMEMGLKQVPIPTKILIWIGKWFPVTWEPLLVMLILVPIVLKLSFLKWKRLRFLYDKYKLRLPYIGSIMEKSSISKDIRTIAEVFRSGGTIEYAIKLIVTSVEQNIYLKSKFQMVGNYILSGMMLSSAMEKVGIFPPMVIRMVKLGEDTGEMDKTLLRVAEIYEDDMKRRIQALTTIIEPSLEIILGIILGIIALGILLPVYNLVGQMGMTR